MGVLMKENFIKINYKAMAFILERMGKNIKVNEGKIKCMDKDYYNGQMGKNIKGGMLMI